MIKHTMKTLALFVTLTFTPAAAESCRLTIYPPNDTSAEARAYRLYPYISESACRLRREAEERFRFEDRAPSSGGTACMTTFTNNTIITICK